MGTDSLGQQLQQAATRRRGAVQRPRGAVPSSVVYGRMYCRGQGASVGVEEDDACSIHV